MKDKLFNETKDLINKASEIVKSIEKPSQGSQGFSFGASVRDTGIGDYDIQRYAEVLKSINQKIMEIEEEVELEIETDKFRELKRNELKRKRGEEEDDEDLPHRGLRFSGDMYIATRKSTEKEDTPTPKSPPSNNGIGFGGAPLMKKKNTFNKVVLIEDDDDEDVDDVRGKEVVHQPYNLSLKPAPAPAPVLQEKEEKEEEEEEEVLKSTSKKEDAPKYAFGFSFIPPPARIKEDKDFIRSYEIAGERAKKRKQEMMIETYFKRQRLKDGTGTNIDIDKLILMEEDVLKAQQLEEETSIPQILKMEKKVLLMQQEVERNYGPKEEFEEWKKEREHQMEMRRRHQEEFEEWKAAMQELKKIS